ESGLTLHGRLAPTAVRPLHTRLLERFGTMRNTVNQANIEISQALLWTPNQPAQKAIPSHLSILSQPFSSLPRILPPCPEPPNETDTSSVSFSLSNNQTNLNMSSISRATPPPPP